MLERDLAAAAWYGILSCGPHVLASFEILRAFPHSLFPIVSYQRATTLQLIFLTLATTVAFEFDFCRTRVHANGKQDCSTPHGPGLLALKAMDYVSDFYQINEASVSLSACGHALEELPLALASKSCHTCA